MTWFSILNLRISTPPTKRHNPVQLNTGVAKYLLSLVYNTMTDRTSIGDGSSQLVPTGGSDGQRGFSTSGQISWTGLTSSAVSLAVGILSRISATGLDYYIGVVGQKLGAQFQLTTTGRHKVQDALNKLQSYGSLGKALWLEFGVKSPRTNLGNNRGRPAVLCASILECYEIRVVAEILVKMGNRSRAPENLRPSILQWKALLEKQAPQFLHQQRLEN
jgi:hypothetical protein